MKFLALMIASICSLPAQASEILGQTALVCKNEREPAFAVGVYRDLKDPGGTDIFVTTPLGFLGHTSEMTRGDQVTIDIPRVFGSAGDETLIIDFSADKCHPSAVLKTKAGAKTSLIYTSCPVSRTWTAAISPKWTA